ncbi:MAG: thermonuclease family protein [Candidatus Obscuribacterales bacterium]|nr:thermonuclease family protein [Candidatus Obscuribacterales bacterium]
MKIIRSLITSFVSAVILLLPVAAQELTGRVVGVSDGDTITILSNRQLIRIRLAGIDCPEKHQAFGQKAKQFTSALVYDKVVTVNGHGRDRYGRTIADVLLEDGRSLNQELIGAGYAWWYRQYAPGNTELGLSEGRARENKQGLWVEPNPIPPWEFRHRKRQLIPPN